MIDLSVPLQGMQRAEQALERTAVQLASLPLGAEGSGVDTVDLSQSMVALLEARNLMEINVKAMQTAQEMTEHTLDILA